MTWDDDRLARAMRAADPARTPLDEGHSDRAQRVLDDIVSGRRTPATVLHRSAPVLGARLWASIAAVAVLILAALLIVPLAAPSAVALTPPPLSLRNTDDLTLTEVTEMSANALTANTAQPSPMRGSRAVGWYLDATITESGSSSVIVPQVTTVVWEPDLSGSITIVAGRAYLPSEEGSDSPIPQSAPTPGTVLSELAFAPGEFGAFVQDEPGATPDDMRAFLAAYGLPEDFNAGDLMLAVGAAFGEWTLTNQQQASILQLLAGTSDAEVLGTGSDRAGRDVVGVRGVPSTNARAAALLLLSKKTGRIVGLEWMLTEAVTEPSLPAGAVTSYTLWDIEEGEQG